MDSQRPDPVKALEEAKKWYLEEIKRINNALSALKGEVAEPKLRQRISKKIPWGSKIEKVFIDNGEMTVDEIRNKLAENGITQALDDESKNTIYATLARQTKQGILERTEQGNYRRKQLRRRLAPTEEGTPKNDVPSFS